MSCVESNVVFSNVAETAGGIGYLVQIGMITEQRAKEVTRPANRDEAYKAGD